MFFVPDHFCDFCRNGGIAVKGNLYGAVIRKRFEIVIDIIPAHRLAVHHRSAVCFLVRAGRRSAAAASAAASASAAVARIPGEFSGCSLAVIAVLSDCDRLYRCVPGDSKRCRILRAVCRGFASVGGIVDLCAVLRCNAYLNGFAELPAVGCDNGSVKLWKIPDGYCKRIGELCSVRAGRVVTAVVSGVCNGYIDLGVFCGKLSVRAVETAYRNPRVRHGNSFLFIAVVGYRQLAAVKRKPLKVIKLGQRRKLGDFNAVDIIRSALRLCLKCDGAVLELNVIRHDMTLQRDRLRLVRIGVKAQNLVVNHLCNYVPASVRAVNPNPAEKRGIVCNGAVHIGVSNVRNRNAFIAEGIVERIKDIFSAFKIVLVYFGKISDELRLARCDDPQLIGKRYGQFVVNAVKRNLSFVDPVIKSNGRTAYKFVLVDRALG